MAEKEEKKKKTCKLSLCKRETWKDDEHCIFHSEDIEGKREEFKEAFWQEFERQRKDEEKYNFAGFIFPYGISFREKEFDKDVDFCESRFSGVADFGSARFFGAADFGSARFSGKAAFNATRFSGRADFSKAQFYGGSAFNAARFSGEAAFNAARFSGTVGINSVQFPERITDFGHAQFSRRADFRKAQFSGAAYFRDARFSGEAIFVGARFSGGAGFSAARFSGEAAFESAQFSGEAAFNAARFSGPVDFREVQFSRAVNFRIAQFSGVTFFVDVQFSREAAFNGAEFLKFVFFKGIKIGKYHDFKMRDTYLSDVQGLSEFIKKNKKRLNYPKKYLFKVTKFLPENFILILGEKAAARYPIISRKIRDDLYLLKFKEEHKWWYLLWFFLADCGRSFFRWALWSILLAVGFAGIFFSMGPDAFDIRELPYSFLTMMYYSVVTFTTLGFGDIIPKTTAASIWVMAEVIMGYVMLGGLISILANKLARRS